MAYGEAEAEKIFKEGLAAAGLGERELMDLPGSDLRKVVIATVIWGKTTVRMSWISEKLAMKSAANASQQIRRMRARQRSGAKLSKVLQTWSKQSTNVA